MFSIHGVRGEIQTDNKTQYMSREFKVFQKEWKFNHIRSIPYHKRSELAEIAQHGGEYLILKIIQIISEEIQRLGGTQPTLK